MLKHDRCHPRPVLFLSEKLPLLPRTVPHWALISDGIGISLPGNSASFAVFSIFMAAVVVENVTTVVITFLRMSFCSFHTRKNRTPENPISRFC